MCHIPCCNPCQQSMGIVGQTSLPYPINQFHTWVICLVQRGKYHWLPSRVPTVIVGSPVFFRVCSVDKTSPTWEWSVVLVKDTRKLDNRGGNEGASWCMLVHVAVFFLLLLRLISQSKFHVTGIILELLLIEGNIFGLFFLVINDYNWPITTNTNLYFLVYLCFKQVVAVWPCPFSNTI